MKVPKSALDGCNNSFLAAEGDRVKANTRFFADTGCMALLCSHGRPLFVINMTRAGEQQFYVLALLDAYLAELPEWWKVGTLYDIGCQTHLSLEKWNYIEGWRPWLVFGVAIFHAYRHQWACQLWYHPRKAGIWGLRDGEGCERFWSDLRQLIPALHVSGYYRRLYLLDIQIEHIARSKLILFGHALQDRITRTQDHLETAEELLAKTPFTEVFLLEQFELQCDYQMQPVGRQGKNKVFEAVHKVLADGASCDTLRESIRDLNVELATAHHDTPEENLVHASLMDRISVQKDSL